MSSFPPQKLKVGFFPLHSFAKPGGVKRHVLALQNEFQAKGVLSKIVLPRRHLSEKYGKNFAFLGTAFDLPLEGTQSDFTVCFNPLAIDRLLSRERFTVLHFHNFGLHSWQILEKSKAVNILTFHADITSSKIFKTFPFLLDRFKKILAHRMHGIICVAPFQLELFREFRGPKIVIPNGIDLSEFNADVPKIKKYADGKLNILFVVRAEERKGLIYLIRAFGLLRKQNNRIRLLVVGEGPRLPECKNFVRKNMIPGVVFEKAVEKNINQYYNTCDIFVSPAIFGESFGIVLLEAMATGKPVAAFANEGYKNVLTGKGKDFLAKPRDWRALAARLEILIRSETKRKKMGEWGFREAQKYAWPKIAERVLDFYGKVGRMKTAAK